ncbi:MAG TPA: biotin carboxylase N-terminal domain-containing protein [Candidatus Sulfotelmatobacter sp.]|nr:biotin carboxylase N-terminal domain-containing protein [Candidatus Sulfotelmatobacter sp.]
MFDSVLIANRGEIACRIIRTCRRLGLRTIAVHSTADAAARHVALADEAHCIGPAAAAESYLDGEAIVAAALAHRAQAIHPGYGFLSEKTILPLLCERHGLVWIGPSVRAIELMGSKIEAKRVARRAGVQTVPGYDGAEQSLRRLTAEADAVGYPLLIKASAGGGGRGMRRVDEPADFAAALDLARREAAGAFGDDRVLLERYIVRPRHLEVQLAGDRHGNLVHLFERECSVQRNYQKIIEEAPAAHLRPAVRERLLAAALSLGRAIGYDSLGTVEFVLDADADDEPYFLEMNTRLQVEHPVTEAVTGLDLVELQLRIAGGEKLPASQEEIRLRGAAIEARINAEDPAAGFRPEIGRILAYAEPAGEGVRVDSGLQLGSEITPYYDSMLLKVIALGADRAAAVRRLAAALDRLVILGVGTNAAFLRALVSAPAFQAVPLTTGFIAETFPGGWSQPPIEPWLPAAAAAAAILSDRQAAAADTSGNPWRRLAGFRLLGRAGHPGRALLRVAAPGDPARTVEIKAEGGVLFAQGEGEDYRFLPADRPGEFVVRLGAWQERVIWRVSDSAVHLFANGRAIRMTAALAVADLAAGATAKAAGGADIVAAMPGLVTEVAVSIGQVVRRGDIVVVMEAMKLVLSLTAAADGIVRVVHCAAGQTVAGGARLVEIAPSANAAEA